MVKLKAKLAWKGLLKIKDYRVSLISFFRERAETALPLFGFSFLFFLIFSLTLVPFCAIEGWSWWTQLYLWGGYVGLWALGAAATSIMQSFVLPVGESSQTLRRLRKKCKNFTDISNDKLIANDHEVQNLRSSVEKLFVDSVDETIKFNKNFDKEWKKATSNREYDHLEAQEKAFIKTLKKRIITVELAADKLHELKRAAEEMIELKNLQEDQILAEATSVTNQTHDLLKAYSDDLEERVSSIKEANKELKETFSKIL